jgi:hypothetical protein
MDELKEVLFENNVYLVTLTFVLSCLQTIFQFLAVKNDIHVWKNIEKYQGLSLKVLYTDLVVSFVCVLYLLDNSTSRMIIFFEVINIFVTCWKIYRTSKF